MARTTTLPPPPSTNGTPGKAAPLAEPVVVGRNANAYNPGAGVTLGLANDDVLRAKGDLAYRLMLDDEVAGSAVDLLIGSALGEGPKCGPIYPAPPDGKPDPKHERAQRWADFGGRLLERLDRPPIDTLMQYGREAFAFGSCNGELVWEVPTRGPDAGKSVLNRIAVLDRADWRFQVDGHNRVLKIYAQTADGWRWVDPEKFAWLTFHATADDPRGRSGLRRAWRAYDMKAQMLPDEREYLAHFGTPSVVLTMPKAADMPEQLYELDDDGNPDYSAPINPLKAAQAQLAGFQNKTYLIIPGGSVFQVVESRGNGAAFDAASTRYDAWIDAAILGASNVRQEAAAGGYAQSKTHAGVFGLRVAFYRVLIAEMIRWQILYRALKYNAGEDEADEYTPTVTLGTGDQDERMQALEAIAKLLIAGLRPSQIGAPLFAQAGLPAPEDEPPPQPAVAPPPPPGQDGSGGPAPGQQPQDQQQQAA